MNEKEMRELDAFIAEHVMGWNSVQSIHDLNSKNDFCVNGEEQKCWVVDFGNRIKPFSPTTDRADAMEVLERCANVMREGVFGYDITIQNRGGRWNVSSWPQLGIEVEADTLPLAIALFARKLFGEGK